MKTFRNKELQVLVATDIAARGIDVKGVDAVINYDVPKDMEYYIHRIGRTARAKMTGNAYTLISNDINGNVRKIERCINEKIKEYKFNDYFPEKSERPILNREQHHDHQPRKIHFDNNKDSVRFFITIGNKDKFDNKSLRNTLVKNIGIPNDDIIDVYTKDTYSFIEVKKNSVDKITNLKQLNGRQIKVKVADQRNKNNSPSNHKPFHKNNHRFNHHHKPHFSKFRKNNSSY
jgi:superfamily II DNA/RNA helicase